MLNNLFGLNVRRIHDRFGDATLNRFNRSGDNTLMVSADYLEVVMTKQHV